MKGNTSKMKKMIMALALVAGMSALASVDVYQFSGKLRFPAIGQSAFVPASTAVKGTLTVENGEDATNATATLVVTLKKTGDTFTLAADGETAYAVFGKKGDDVSTEIKFVSEDPTEGLTELTFSGFGKLKTKKTGGCTPCGDTTEICSRVTKLDGVLIGRYICPCGGEFTEWDGGCEIGDDTVADMAVHGAKATFTLKTVDGKKWK